MDRKRNYFDFHGVRYGVGTVVKLKLDCNGNLREIERCGGIARFVGGFESGLLTFSGVEPVGYIPCNIGIRGNPDNKIEEIISPVYYEHKPSWQIALDNYQKTPKGCRRDIAPGTVLYIATMLVGSIFKGNFIIWIVATLIYMRYLINIYLD